MPLQAVDPVFLAFQSAVAGRYSIDRELGRGGMGIVYLAHEVHLDRLVAIKLLPPDKAADPSLRERFLREAQLAAKLSHPNIIPIHAVAEVDGFVFYVMAFIDGETLTRRVQTRGPLVGSEAVRILREVAWALAHAHAQGLVHRDVKPDNILIEASSGRALVADFGIAAAIGEGASLGAAGTPEFMSPEQAANVPVDARSDVYSLGATAFYACSGRVPFEGDTAAAILARHLTESPPSLRSVGLSVPRKLAQLVDRCLAKDPEQRPQSADDLAEQLGVALEQRRELPVALRAFVKRSSRLDGGGTLIVAGSLMAGSVTAASFYGWRTGLAAFVLGAGLGKLGFFVRAARRLLQQGFTHADLAPAFDREREQASEELAVDQSRGTRLLERSLKVAAGTCAAAGATALVGTFITPGSYADLLGLTRLQANAVYGSLVSVFLWSLVMGFGSTISYLALLQRRRDVDTDVWARLWTGPAGRLAFAIAKRSVNRLGPVGAVTHRATELSLGLAAEQLFESLPKDMRAALANLPGILARLQDDAQSLRRRYDRLQEALAGASQTAEHEDLRQLRDETHARLGDAVAALETIRLNLLRLHAGQSSVEGLTTHLGLAADVSRQVERLIVAHEEVEETLRFPRLTVPTPV
ncbi:MAG TPA: serine/threonine-protein kinase [Gemmatimonadaceae bacterium]